MSRIRIVMLALGTLVLLVACGSAERATEQPQSETIPPATPSPQAAQPTATASATPAATPSASPSASPGASLTANDSKYAGIPQSTTAEGYYVLGDPTAPVVLTHYSDFL